MGKAGAADSASYTGNQGPFRISPVPLSHLDHFARVVPGIAVAEPKLARHVFIAILQEKNRTVKSRFNPCLCPRPPLCPRPHSSHRTHLKNQDAGFIDLDRERLLHAVLLCLGSIVNIGFLSCADAAFNAVPDKYQEKNYCKK